jgi:hypothetical protein
MTVIASYNHFGCGLVIGDILITARAKTGKRRRQTYLPTLGNVSKFSYRVPRILSPQQKVCIITDYCAIAWAGELRCARELVARLARISRRIRITETIIARFLKKYPGKEVKVVGAIYEDGRLQTFGLECEKLSCPTLGDVYAAGSGAPIIHDYVRTVKELHLSPPPEDEIAARGVSLALTQVAHLLNAEFRKGDAADSIQDFFGGGYEIAAFYGGKFNKITANFVFLDVSLQNGFLKIGYPPLVISQSYLGETLRYRALAPRGPEDNRIRRNETIEVPPFFKRVDNDAAPLADSPANFTCFVFVDNFKFCGTALISTVLKTDTPPFECFVANSELDIRYSEAAEEHIEEFLMERYQGS